MLNTRDEKHNAAQTAKIFILFKKEGWKKKWYVTLETNKATKSYEKQK